MVNIPTQQMVTIIVPNYKTLELTKLCLRLLRKHTNLKKAKVIVVDNDSQDHSLQYLKTLAWIDLIERKAIPGESPTQSHARALDMALDRVTTPYVLSIHTDTLIKRPNWLDFLMNHFEKNPRVAGVGSWKLESKSSLRQILKGIEHTVQRVYYKITNKTVHGLEGVGDNYYYLRSHCAMYRTRLLKKLNLQFSDGNMVAGKLMHKRLVDAGYQMIFLPSRVLLPYVEHINHATTVLNPTLSSRQKSIDKGTQRIKKSLARINAEAILRDASLDV